MSAIKSGQSNGIVEVTPSGLTKKQETWQRWYAANPDANMRGYHRWMERNGNRRRALVRAERKRRGDACQDCGESEKRLQWHHRVPGEKKFALAKASQKPDADVLAELEKCDLLCHNCHAKRHVEMRAAWA